MNITVSTHHQGLIFFSLALPLIRLSRVQEMTPMAMPSEMLYARGIAAMVRKAGMPSRGSLKSILAAEPSCRSPR